jgi:hypothetical protein
MENGSRNILVGFWLSQTRAHPEKQPNQKKRGKWLFDQKGKTSI